MKVGIVGAGILGRLLAFEMLHSGHDVTIFDKDSTNLCSNVAAGLLMPTTELEKNPMIIYDLGMESLTRCWPALISQIDQSIYFKSNGSLIISHPREKADLTRYIKIISSKLSHDCYQHIDKAEIFQLEPELSKFDSAYYFPCEAHLDNQNFLHAIKHYCLSNGVDWVAKEFSFELDKRNFDFILDCRGLEAKDVYKDLRAVRGELIWLHAPDVSISRPVRFLHPRYSLYVVPRPGNVYLVGASEIESDDDSHISVKTTLEFLTAAYYIHPGFAEATMLKTVTQKRPTLSNHLPKIKYSENTIAINGLYRHGFLIAPALVADVSRYLKNDINAVRYPSLWESWND